MSYPEQSHWKAGQSGNPAGRPKGARQKLSEAFLKALADDFAAHGAGVISAVRETDPSTYIRVVASVLPKQIGFDEDAPLRIERIERVIVDAAKGRPVEHPVHPDGTGVRPTH